MTKQEREEREYKSLFTDERYAKRAWKQFIAESLTSDAPLLPDFLDAKGNVLPQSTVYDVAHREVSKRLKAKGIERAPMKAEIIAEANVIQASFNNNIFNTLLDRTAGKVKEELNVTAGQFEELTDDELAVLAAHRAQQRLTGGVNDTTDN